MQGPPCNVQVRREQGVATVRVEGRASMNFCPGILRWVDDWLAQEAARIQVDLSRCTYMDSTFVGTLLSLFRRCKDRCPGTLRLLAPSPACAQVLRQMHLLDIFTVSPDADAATAGWTALPADCEERKAVLGQVVQAHQELAALPGEVGKTFRGIAEELSSEM